MRRAKAQRIAVLCVAAFIALEAVGLSLLLVLGNASVDVLACFLTVPFLFSLAAGDASQAGWRLWIAWVGVAASMVMLLCFALGALNVNFPDSPWIQFFATVGTAGALLPGLISSLWRQKLRTTGGRWMRWISIALAAAVTAAFIVNVYLGPGIFGSPPLLGGRFMTVSLVCLASSLIMLPLVEKGWPRDDQAGQLPPISVKLNCPRCGSEQSLKAGGDACRACGLTMQIEVESPRCKCGYLLVGIQGDVCPECGRNARGKSWPAPASAAAISVTASEE